MRRQLLSSKAVSQVKGDTHIGSTKSAGLVLCTLGRSGSMRHAAYGGML